VLQESFDETEGYMHEASGVGFVYPAGWENLGTKALGPVTQLGLRKDQGAIEVTLSWTPLGPKDQADIGSIELAGLRPLHGDKVGKPEPIRLGEKSGYKLPIAGGPLGVGGAELSGVVYVFDVRRGSEAWKIKLRATVSATEDLTTVHDLLRNHRWN
jgi:hypothetical protein